MKRRLEYEAVVIWIVIYAIICNCSLMRYDTISYCSYVYFDDICMLLLLFSYLLSLCNFPVSIEITMGWNDTYPNRLQNRRKSLWVEMINPSDFHLIEFGITGWNDIHPYIFSGRIEMINIRSTWLYDRKYIQTPLVHI